ncbi:glycine/sarcosine/betaine reductase selenoprotein B family protein [Clostridium sp.]|uniref:glycine/sarcosine/betaine reductase selenoprotein B family protein n=1 Tax=Clostridium sp. TaxID=1506 RepID=UPI0026DA8CF3|nr:glycine/sarcosine/betaine reductase selenoprotein B family protein [Clostridium sp.]MDO5040172.1 glycine/sarcosine/betaine reductase selenoprotein B family protein [Clostridium sp.]
MKRVVLVLNNAQVGLGNRENDDLAPAGRNDVIGPGKLFEPYLKKNGAEIIATLYCGDKYYLDNKIEAEDKFISMVEKLKADIVICGPALHYFNFGKMAIGIAEKINNIIKIPTFAVISSDNPVLQYFDDSEFIFITPNKKEINLDKFIKIICDEAMKRLSE